MPASPRMDADGAAPQTGARFDVGAIGPARITPEGYWEAEATLAVPGVMTYRYPGRTVRELVTADVLSDPAWLKELEGKPVTIEHPPDMLTPQTIRDYRKGVVLAPVRWDGERVVATLRLDDADAIRAVQREGKREVSPGYMTQWDTTPGIDGTYGAYDQRQVRRYDSNHVALTGRGRGGRSVALHLRNDSDAYQIGDSAMNPLLLQLLAAAGIDAAGIADDAAAVAALTGKIKPPTGTGPTDPAKEKEVNDLKAQITDLKAQIATAQGRLAEIDPASVERMVEDAVMMGAAAPDAEMDACGGPKMDSAVKRGIIKRIAPLVSKLGAEAARLDSLIGDTKPEGWAALGLRARRKLAAKRLDSAIPDDETDDFYRAVLTRAVLTRAVLPVGTGPSQKPPSGVRNDTADAAPKPLRSATRASLDSLTAAPAQKD